jgi:hypothetical protein
VELCALIWGFLYFMFSFSNPKPVVILLNLLHFRFLSLVLQKSFLLSLILPLFSTSSFDFRDICLTFQVIVQWGNWLGSFTMNNNILLRDVLYIKALLEEIQYNYVS